MTTPAAAFIVDVALWKRMLVSRSFIEIKSINFICDLGIFPKRGSSNIDTLTFAPIAWHPVGGGASVLGGSTEGPLGGNPSGV